MRADITALRLRHAVVLVKEIRLVAPQKLAVHALPCRHLEGEVHRARRERFIGAGAQGHGVIVGIATVIHDHGGDQRVLPRAAEARVGFAFKVLRAGDVRMVGVVDQPPGLALHRDPEPGDQGAAGLGAHKAERGHVGEIHRASRQKRGRGAVGIGENFDGQPGLVEITVLLRDDQADVVGVERPVECDTHVFSPSGRGREDGSKCECGGFHEVSSNSMVLSVDRISASAASVRAARGVGIGMSAVMRPGPPAMTRMRSASWVAS